MGVELNRDLVKVAGKALEKNLTRMGPLVLPVTEQLRFAHNFVQRKILGKRHIKAYVPDFTGPLTTSACMPVSPSWLFFRSYVTADALQQHLRCNAWLIAMC